jgi:hypothetical protein
LEADNRSAEDAANGFAGTVFEHKATCLNPSLCTKALAEAIGQSNCVATQRSSTLTIQTPYPFRGHVCLHILFGRQNAKSPTTPPRVRIGVASKVPVNMLQAVDSLLKDRDFSAIYK